MSDVLNFVTKLINFERLKTIQALGLVEISCERDRF